LVTKEAAVRVIRLTAHGAFGICGAVVPAKTFSCGTLGSLLFTLPIARRGLNGIIPTAFQALQILSSVNVSLRAGIRILFSLFLHSFKKKQKVTMEVVWGQKIITNGKNSPLFIPALPFLIKASRPLL